MSGICQDYSGKFSGSTIRALPRARKVHRHFAALSGMLSLLTSFGVCSMQQQFVSLTDCNNHFDFLVSIVSDLDSLSQDGPQFRSG